MPSGGITISGGSGSDTIAYSFTVTGTNTLRYATALQNSINSLIGPTSGGGQGESVTPIYQGGTPAGGLAPAPGTPVFNLIPESKGGSFFINAPGYIVDSIGGAETINGHGGGESVIVAAVNPATTYEANGSNNLVVFVDGNNTYLGTGVVGLFDTGNDTIVAGSGFDTIKTSQIGQTTVNSGTGDATVYLNDTTAASVYSGVFNDHVWLDDGHSTIYANGTADAVISTAEGQTIYGGSTANSVLAVVLAPVAGGGNANDYVSAGAGTATVVSDAGGNTVAAGSGVLYYVAGAGVSDTLVAGSGAVYGYTGANDSVSVSGTGTGSFTFLVGTGNETINGAGTNESMTLFAQTDTAAGNQVLIGGSGNNYFFAGAGSETLTGGADHNAYYINSTESAGATITITDFGAGSNDTLVLEPGFSQQDVQTLLTGGTSGASGYSVTLSDGVTLNFQNLTSGSALSGHIISQ